MTFKIVVSGTRDGWNGKEVKLYLDLVRHYLTKTDPTSTEPIPYGELVHGNARGLDLQADLIWRRKFMGTSKPFPADWNKYGRSAGHRRNATMLNYALNEKDWFDIPFAILAFQGWNSKGTFGVQQTDYLKDALNNGIPFFWVRSDESDGQLHKEHTHGAVNAHWEDLFPSLY